LRNRIAITAGLTVPAPIFDRIGIAWIGPSSGTYKTKQLLNAASAAVCSISNTGNTAVPACRR
jgi:hypothetical protein